MFQEMSFPSTICLLPEYLFFSQNDCCFSNFVWGKFKFRVKKFNFKLRKIGPSGGWCFHELKSKRIDQWKFDQIYNIWESTLFRELTLKITLNEADRVKYAIQPLPSGSEVQWYKRNQNAYQAGLSNMHCPNRRCGKQPHKKCNSYYR